MALVKPHKQTYSADLLIFDIHGSFTGAWGKHQWLPPREGEQDWEIGVEGLQYVMNEYNTFEIIPPASSRKDGTWGKINKRQYSDKESWTADRSLYQDVDVPDEYAAVGGREEQSDPAPVEVAGPSHEWLPAVTMLESAGGPISLATAKSLMREGGAGRFTRDGDSAQEWLESWGWQVYDDPILKQPMVLKGS